MLVACRPRTPPVWLLAHSARIQAWAPSFSRLPDGLCCSVALRCALCTCHSRTHVARAWACSPPAATTTADESADWGLRRLCHVDRSQREAPPSRWTCRARQHARRVHLLRCAIARGDARRLRPRQERCLRPRCMQSMLRVPPTHTTCVAAGGLRTHSQLGPFVQPACPTLCAARLLSALCVVHRCLPCSCEKCMHTSASALALPPSRLNNIRWRSLLTHLGACCVPRWLCRHRWRL